MHISTRNCRLFPVPGVQLEFFRAKARGENAVGLPGAEEGALSRFMTLAGIFGFAACFFPIQKMGRGPTPGLFSVISAGAALMMTGAEGERACLLARGA